MSYVVSSATTHALTSSRILFPLVTHTVARARAPFERRVDKRSIEDKRGKTTTAAEQLRWQDSLEKHTL